VKTLIVEDDLTSHPLLQEFLKSCGQFNIAVNGKDAVEAVRLALESDEPYDLICMDIMMPEMDGQKALKEIRTLEEAKGIFFSNRVKIIMVTALGNMKDVKGVSKQCCSSQQYIRV
jgi:two-component system chemotaxis response regulator CheY